MKTVGQILKQARIKKNLQIAQAAKITKIRPAYLVALEEDEFQKLPSAASARGFIKNYAEFLGLSSAQVLAVFRRDFDEKKVKKMSSRLATKPLAKLKLVWTPKLTTIFLIVFLTGLFLVYLVWQYFSLINAPYY